MGDKDEFQQLKKQYPEFFKEASDKLIELAISTETASQIAEICLKNGVKESEKIEKIAYYINFVLLSQLPPGTLPKALKKNLKLKPEIAEKIFQEVNETIFFRVKDDLAKLYPKMVSAKPSAKIEKSPSPSQEEPKKSLRKDVYREKIE